MCCLKGWPAQYLTMPVLLPARAQARLLRLWLRCQCWLLVSSKEGGSSLLGSERHGTFTACCRSSHRVLYIANAVGAICRLQYKGMERGGNTVHSLSDVRLGSSVESFSSNVHGQTHRKTAMHGAKAYRRIEHVRLRSLYYCNIEAVGADGRMRCCGVHCGRASISWAGALPAPLAQQRKLHARVLTCSRRMAHNPKTRCGLQCNTSRYMP